MKTSKRDFFISHAGADLEGYIQPLINYLRDRGITFWLDAQELEWGDSLALSINEGLRESRYVLLCLSKAFLSRSWPEAELGAAITAHTESGEKKVLPLILNSKEEVLARYPLIAGLVYREYKVNNFAAIADELSAMTERAGVAFGDIRVLFESVHTGRRTDLVVPVRATVAWLAAQARLALGLKDSLETGGFEEFPIRWVLVDTRAEDEWQRMIQADQSILHAVVRANDGIRISLEGLDRLENVGVYNDIVFHLYAAPEDPFHHVSACA